MSQLVLTKSSDLRQGIRKTMFGLKLEVGPSMLIVSLIVFVCLISVVTLMHSTKEVTKGFFMSSLEEQREGLVRSYEVQTMKLAEATSLSAIQSSDKYKRMVKPRGITYVYADGAIASR